MRPALLSLFLLAAPVTAAFAQDPTSPSSADPQIELNLVNLPTTRSLAAHKSYARFTHRFARDLGIGDFGDLASDLFSLDNGAVIGLEYRFGIISGLQAGIHRNTLNKTLQVFGRWDAIQQGGALPIGVSAVARGPRSRPGGLGRVDREMDGRSHARVDVDELPRHHARSDRTGRHRRVVSGLQHDAAVLDGRNAHGACGA
jgi:hypothetical protein